MAAAYAEARRDARLRRERAKKARRSVDVDEAAVVALAPCPSLVRYADAFVSEAEAAALPEQLRALAGWRQMPRGRRVLSVGGTPHPGGAWAEPLPECLSGLAARVARFFADGRAPDQALVNDYEAGGGIDPHRDGPCYESTAVVVSLESSARLDFFADGARTGSVLLRPRSLVAFSGAAYADAAHGISAARSDAVDELVRNRREAAARLGEEVPRAATRLSVTFRRFADVARTLDDVDATLLSDADRAELKRRRAWWAASISEKDAATISPPQLHRQLPW